MTLMLFQLQNTILCGTALKSSSIVHKVVFRPILPLHLVIYIDNVIILTRILGALRLFQSIHQISIILQNIMGAIGLLSDESFTY